jgi:hypothetical protein
MEYAVPTTAPDSDRVVIDRRGLTTMLRLLVAVCAVGLVESVASTVKAEVPLVVGVPEMTPVPAARLRPAGSAPLLIDQVYGGVPPLAASVAE